MGGIKFQNENENHFKGNEIPPILEWYTSLFLDNCFNMVSANNDKTVYEINTTINQLMKGKKEVTDDIEAEPTLFFSFYSD